MLFRDWQQLEIKDFQGSWTAAEPTDVPLNRALDSQNVEFFPGQVKVRFGFGSIQTPGDAIASMENWIHSYNNSNYNLLAYLATSGAHAGIDLLDLANGTVTNLYTVDASTKGAVFVQAGSRLYICTFNGNNWTLDAPRVYLKEFDFSSLPNNADKLFPTPPDCALTFSQPSPGGSITAGTKRFGFLITTRSGYTEAVGPTATLTDLPTYTTVNNGAIVMTVTPPTTWPDDVDTLQMLMSTSDNNNTLYLVPGAFISIAAGAGSATPFSVSADISDDDLAATGEPALAYFSRFAPNNPSYMTTYSSRMVYVTVTKDQALNSVLYISEPNDYQNVTEDQHAVYLPGQIAIVAAFSLYNTLYIVGPHWTYQTSDTGDVPSTWSQPKVVDGRIGTLSPLGVTVNASQGLAWVADTEGLYLFIGGNYSQKPISYYNQDQWDRINWAAANTCLKVIDDTANKRVKVIAPLDSATTPSHILTWDYTRGIDPESVSFSLDSINSYSLGSGALVQNNSTKKIEFWVAPSNASEPIMRQLNSADNNPHEDDGNAILPVFETALMPPVGAQVLQHHADHFRLQGEGGVDIEAKTLDGGKVLSTTQLLVADDPAQFYLRRYHALSEGVSIRLSSTGVGTNWKLSAITHYFTPWVTNR